jgi:hypothetical protein
LVDAYVVCAVCGGGGAQLLSDDGVLAGLDGTEQAGAEEGGVCGVHRMDVLRMLLQVRDGGDEGGGRREGRAGTRRVWPPTRGTCLACCHESASVAALSSREAPSSEAVVAAAALVWSDVGSREKREAKEATPPSSEGGGCLCPAGEGGGRGSRWPPSRCDESDHTPYTVHRTP